MKHRKKHNASRIKTDFILIWASLAEECGVATHDPMSWRTH